MTTQVVPVGTLRKGRRFKMNGDEYRVLYGNQCRSHVQLIRPEIVPIPDRRTGSIRTIKAQSQPINIAPTTAVTVTRRG